jgi:dodecin
MVRIRVFVGIDLSARQYLRLHQRHSRADVRGWGRVYPPTREEEMAESVYRVTEVIGVSADSWEQAARNAVETVAGSVRELRIAEVVREDVTIEDGKVSGFRVRLGVSFKYDKD